MNTMIDKQRQIVVDEIERLKRASAKSHSDYLKKDYSKAIKRLTKELNDYDRFRGYHGNKS